MAQEKVDIVIKERREGTAIRDAEADLQRLKRGGSGPGAAQPASAPAAAPKRMTMEDLERKYGESASAKTGGGDGDSEARAEQRRNAKEAALSRQIALSTQLEAIQKRAAGDEAGAAAAEREAEILARSAAIQKGLNIPKGEAMVMARQQVVAEEKIAADALLRARAEKEVTREKARQVAAGGGGGRIGGTLMTAASQLGAGGLSLNTAGRTVGGLAGLGGGAAGMVAGSVAAAVAAALGRYIGEIITDSLERGGIENRDVAERTKSGRSLGIMAGLRGTSGDAVQEEWAIEQRIADRAADWKEVERKARRHPLDPRRLIDGDYTWEGQRAMTEHAKAQVRDRDELEKVREVRKKKVATEEVSMELAALRGRSERTFGGAREAAANEAALDFLKDYRRLLHETNNEEMAFSAAKTKTELRLRDRQAQGASGLVSAASGSRDIAAAAAWAQMTVPGMDDVGVKIDGVRATIRGSSAAQMEQSGRRKMTPDPL